MTAHENHASAPQPRRLLQATDWAFIVVTAAAYLSLFLQSDFRLAPVTLLLLVALGVLYTAIGTYGFEIYVYLTPTKIKLLYFVFQLLLSTGIILLGRLGGALWLLWIPLISHSVVLFDRKGAIISSVLVIALFGALVGMMHGWQIGLSTGLAFAPGVIFVMVFTEMALNEARTRAEVERLAQDLRIAHDELARYAIQIEELAMEKERTRLAREIHDSLGHYLTAINIQLEAARAVQADETAPVVPLLSRAQALTKEGLQEIRRSVAALRTSPLADKPLPLLIETLAEGCRASGIETACTIAGTLRPLSPMFELALYRAVQEALTNVRKHAQAQHVSVTLTYAAESVHLRVEDDGIGSAEHAGGFGLVGLRERVQLLGGELEITSTLGAGFVLDITLRES